MNGLRALQAGLATVNREAKAHPAAELLRAHWGLSAREAARRLSIEGPNIIVQNKRFTAIFEFLWQFRNPLVGLLIIAAVISAAVGDPTSATIIVAIVIMGATLDFINTYKSERAAEALQAHVMVTATILRDKQPQELPLVNIVRGDVILLAPGDLVPADGVLKDTRDFFVDESSLTGESLPRAKSTNDPIMMGSSIVTGRGLMEVTATGQRTKFGAIAAALSTAEEPTAFDRDIQAFSLLILWITFAMTLFVLVVNTFLKHNLLESTLFALALAVGLTPQLLPMIIALNLSRGSILLARHGVIVKRLSALQNFGSMDVLCTDKTGTLTEDKITLVKYVNSLGHLSDEVLRYAYLISVNESGVVSPLNEAIRDFRVINTSDYRKIDEIPFDFTRKRTSVVVEHRGERLLIALGAPEDVLAVSTQFHDQVKGSSKRAHQEKAMGVYHRLSQDGFRVLAVACRVLTDTKLQYATLDEHDLVFYGFVAFLDPPKATAEETLRMLEKHHIEIKIITGDNDLVTVHIAKELSLPTGGVVLGSAIETMNEAALRRCVETTTIFARILPDQKMRIIQALRANGHVVGYIGDGINDAPSLKAADVGISVNNAVDVAKESADLILLHKNLRQLANGVVQGRRTFANTLKYLMMALSSNFGNMFSMAGASVFLPFLPMLPAQLLLNNLLYDTSQFAIPLDKVDADDVRWPRSLDLKFVKRFMLVFGPISSLFDFLTFFLLFWVFRFGAAAFQTGWFIESLATQTLVVYIIRTKRWPFLQSRPSMALLASTLAMVTIGVVVSLSPLGAWFGFKSLPPLMLLTVVLIVLAYLGLTEVAKRLFFRHYALEYGGQSRQLRPLSRSA